MKTINIKGKEYVEVNERIKYFRENYDNTAILTYLLSDIDDKCTFKAEILVDGECVAVGHAYEVEGSSFINKTSYIENCETSAVGRCLGFLNIGLVGSIATADEVSNAIHQQDDTLLPLGKYKGDSWTNVAQKDYQYLVWVVNGSEWDEKFKQKAREALIGLAE